MLTPFDDYPVHQTALPVAHPASGDPNHYDRFFFNAYRDDLYVGVAMGLYPNRGVIDAAISTVNGGVQRSVFASGRIPADRTRTEVGPLSIEVTEPLRTTRVRCAPGHGIEADLTFTARTAVVEEPRQTMYQGPALLMDSTRLTQWGTWSGTITSGGAAIDLGAGVTYGTKDRSWGVRPVGEPAPAAPATKPPQVFFLWAPISFDDCATHFFCFEHSDGRRWAQTAAIIPVLESADAPTWGVDDAIEECRGGDYTLEWAPGLRRSRAASVRLDRIGEEPAEIALEPLLTFRMRGIGYAHPEWGHGRWKGELEIGAEEHPVEALDNLEPWNIHIQQVVRATWGERTGIGVLEQLAFGPHVPTGLHDFLDGG